MVRGRRYEGERLAARVVTRSGLRPGWMLGAIILTLFALLLSSCGEQDEAVTTTDPTLAPSPMVEVTPEISEPLPTAEVTEAPVEETAPLPTVEETEAATATMEAEEEAATMEAEPEATVTGAPGDITTLIDITQNPAAFYGETVTVEGGVNVVESDTAFTIADNTLVDAGEVLVVSVDQNVLDMALNADEPVRVTGEVREFMVTQIENDLGIDLEDAHYDEFENKPVIVAESVEVIEGASDVGDPATDANVTVAEIAGNLAAFTGQEVTVREEVEEVIGENAFSIDEDAAFEGGIDSDLLVVSAEEGATIKADDLVTITGTVRAFDLAEVEQEVGYDLEDDLFTDWAGRPAIVAQAVQVVEDMPDVTVAPYDPAIADEFGRNITVAEIAGNAAEFLGQTVTVREEIEEVIGPGVFALDEDALLAGGIDSDLLVISMPQGMGTAETMTPMATAEETTTPVATVEATMEVSPAATETGAAVVTEWEEGQLVEVTGTVRNLVITEIEREFGLDLDEELVVDFQDRPAIIATEVRLIDPTPLDDPAED